MGIILYLRTNAAKKWTYEETPLAIQTTARATTKRRAGYPTVVSIRSMVRFTPEMRTASSSVASTKAEPVPSDMVVGNDQAFSNLRSFLFLVKITTNGLSSRYTVDQKWILWEGIGWTRHLLQREAAMLQVAVTKTLNARASAYANLASGFATSTKPAKTRTHAREGR